MRNLSGLGTGFAALILLALSLATTFAHAYNPPSPKQTLVILNWSSYMDPDVIQAFEARYNAEVRVVFFESDELRNDMLLEAGGAGYDLVLVNGVNLDSYRKRGWLEPLPAMPFENYRHLDPHWLTAFPGAQGYGVPYFWGTIGIAYRADLVDRPLTRWKDLLEPDPQLSGRISMIEDSRDLLATALKALGYSANSTDAGEIQAAEALLLKQKPHVKSYNYVALDEQSALVKGDLLAAMVYSGDALMLQEHNEHIAFALPEEGSMLWVDYMVVMKQSQNKALAWDFVNFINEPENAAKMAEFVWYATPNRAAEKLLSAEFLANPVIYPSEAALKRSEFHKELPPRTMRKRNLAFARVVR